LVERDSNSIVTPQHLGRVLLGKDWIRFEHYAPFVRKLAYGLVEKFEGKISAALEGSLQRRLQPGDERYLLPNLTHLIFFSRESEDLRSFRNLLSANLTTLELGLLSENVSEHLPHMVESVLLISPAIRELSIDGYYEDTSLRTIGQSITPLFRSLPNIKHLQMDRALFVSVVQQGLTSLPNLTSMHFFTNLTIETVDPAGFVTASSFLPALEKVSGGNHRADPLQKFWTPLVFGLGRAMTDISVSGTLCDGPELKNFFSVLGNTSHSLRILSMADLAVLRPITPQELSGLFRPLLKCTQMVKLEVYGIADGFDMSFALTDQDITQMASVWPNIEELHLVSPEVTMIPKTQPPTLSLSAISSLCALCPRLHSLILTVDAETCPAEPCLLSRSSLQRLHFARSWISDPWRVAIWLGDICSPEAIGIAEIGRSHDSRVEEWNRVKDIVGHLQNVRKADQERIREMQKEIEDLRAQLRAAKPAKETVHKSSPKVGSSKVRLCPSICFRSKLK
jgi:hypothetical protein